MTMYQHYTHVPPDAWPVTDFSPAEIACRGSGSLYVNDRALLMLQALRSKLGRPMIVNSGYRSPAYNRRIGGARQSKHMEGMAFDVAMDNHDPAEFIAAARQVGFRGIGTYPRSNFIHVDARSYDATWGDPFPVGAPRFASRPPARERLAGSRTMRGAGMAGTGIAGQAAADAVRDRLAQGAAEPDVIRPTPRFFEGVGDAVTETATDVQRLLPLVDGLWWLFLGLSLLGTGVTIYARWDDWHRGAR